MLLTTHPHPLPQSVRFLENICRKKVSHELALALPSSLGAAVPNNALLGTLGGTSGREGWHTEPARNS